MAAKVNFNEITKIITVTLAPDVNGEIYIDVKTDLYSDGKEDWVINENLRKFVFPVRSAGGDDLPGSKALGATFFLASDWKIRPYEASHKLIINGNLYSEDGTDPFLDTVGTYTVRIIQQVSSLVDSTVQQLAEIEYASFGGGVSIDITSSNTGTDYPVGNKAFPVNNLTDAILIAESRGFDTLFIDKSMTLDAGTNIEYFNVIGKSHVNTSVIITDSLICPNLTIKNCNVTGIMDGGTNICECSIGDLTYINGHVENSGLYGTIILGGNEEAIVANCFSIDQDNSPVIDMGGSGQDLAMPNYAGQITIQNLNSASEEVGIGLNAGLVILTPTVSAGFIGIAGIGTLMDFSTGTTSVNVDGLISKQTIAEAVIEQTSITSDYAQGPGIGDNQIQLATNSSSVSGTYDPSMVSITEGAGIGQARLIYQYDGVTKTATVDRNWKTLPDTSSKYIIHAHPGREHVNEGLARGGTTDTITLNTLASSADNAYKGQLVFLRAGIGEDQVRLITSYDGNTKVAILVDSWSVIPDTTTSYVIIPSYIHSPSDIAEYIWCEKLADHKDEGSFGAELSTKADIAAASSTNSSFAISGSVIYGTQDSGTYLSTNVKDNTYWEIEENASTGLTVELIFNIPDENKAGVFRVFGRYEGVPSSAHYQELWIYNYEALAWEQLLEEFLPGGNTSDLEYVHEYYERNIDRTNNNEVKVRIIHNVTTYNASHHMFLDFAEVTSIDVITAADIADAVWAEEEARRVLGLLDENSYFDQQIYNVNDRLLSGRKRTYSVVGSVGTNNDVIATYTITCTWSGNQLTSYKVIKV